MRETRTCYSRGTERLGLLVPQLPHAIAVLARIYMRSRVESDIPQSRRVGGPLLAELRKKCSVFERDNIYRHQIFCTQETDDISV